MRRPVLNFFFSFRAVFREESTGGRPPLSPAVVEIERTHALTHVRRSRVRDLKIIRGRRPVYVFTDPYVEDPDRGGFASRRWHTATW